MAWCKPWASRSIQRISSAGLKSQIFGSGQAFRIALVKGCWEGARGKGRVEGPRRDARRGAGKGRVKGVRKGCLEGARGRAWRKGLAEGTPRRGAGKGRVEGGGEGAREWVGGTPRRSKTTGKFNY